MADRNQTTTASARVKPINFVREAIERLPDIAFAERVLGGLGVGKWVVETPTMEERIAKKVREVPVLDSLRTAHRHSLGNHYNAKQEAELDVALIGCETAISVMRHPDFEPVLTLLGDSALAKILPNAKKMAQHDKTRESGVSLMTAKSEQLGMWALCMTQAGSDLVAGMESQSSPNAQLAMTRAFNNGAVPVLFSLAMQAEILPHS